MGSTNRTPCRSSRTGFVVGSLLLEFGLFSAAKASTIALTPTSSVISSGAPFTIDLNISGLSSNQALSGFDVSVSFDGSKLAYQSATFGDPVLGDQLDISHSGINAPNAIAGTGTVDLIETDYLDSPGTLASSQARSFTLAALSFYGLASGTTPVSITVNSLSDQNGNPFVVTLQNAGVTIQASPVPLPASAWLMLSGLGGVGAFARKKLKPSRNLTAILPAPGL